MVSPILGTLLSSLSEAAAMLLMLLKPALKRLLALTLPTPSRDTRGNSSGFILQAKKPCKLPEAVGEPFCNFLCSMKVAWFNPKPLKYLLIAHFVYPGIHYQQAPHPFASPFPFFLGTQKKPASIH